MTSNISALLQTAIEEQGYHTTSEYWGDGVILKVYRYKAKKRFGAIGKCLLATIDWTSPSDIRLQPEEHFRKPGTPTILRYDLHDPQSVSKLLYSVATINKAARRLMMYTFTRLAIFWIGLISLLGWGGMRIAAGTAAEKYNRHMQDIVEAKDFEDAQMHIDAILNISYVIEGYPATSIFIETPDENVSKWLDELKAWKTKFKEVDLNKLSSKEVLQVRANMFHQFEKSCRVPFGISIYPYNRICFLWFIFGISTLVIGLILNKEWFD